MLGDEVSPPWRVGTAFGVTMAQSADVVPAEGEAALLVTTTTYSFSIEFVTAEPIEQAGLRSVQLALRLDDVTFPERASLAIVLDDIHVVDLLAETEQRRAFVDTSQRGCYLRPR